MAHTSFIINSLRQKKCYILEYVSKIIIILKKNTSLKVLALLEEILKKSNFLTKIFKLKNFNNNYTSIIFLKLSIIFNVFNTNTTS